MPPKKNQPKRGKKSKRRDERPAKRRYWTFRQLEKHKVRNLIVCGKMTPAAALTLWRQTRTKRIPEGFNEPFCKIR